MNILRIITVVICLLLGAVHLCFAKANFGVDFYDEADFLAEGNRFSAQDISILPSIANQKFNLLRTITDFNQGDPSQKICSCYKASGLTANPRQCAFEKAFESTPRFENCFNN